MHGPLTQKKDYGRKIRLDSSQHSAARRYSEKINGFDRRKGAFELQERLQSIYESFKHLHEVLQSTAASQVFHEH
jgi:hypothetical protein